MFEGASHLIFENAKQLRKNMTYAELVLWMHLKKGINKLKFRRQHPIGIYIADFYCHPAKLIIEIDGGIHNQLNIKEHDKVRQQDLTTMGYKVIRFTNEQVIQQAEVVLQTIKQEILNIINSQKLNASSKDGV